MVTEGARLAWDSDKPWALEEGRGCGSLLERWEQVWSESRAWPLRKGLPWEAFGGSKRHRREGLVVGPGAAWLPCPGEAQT